MMGFCGDVAVSGALHLLQDLDAGDGDTTERTRRRLLETWPMLLGTVKLCVFFWRFFWGGAGKS